MKKTFRALTLAATAVLGLAGIVSAAEYPVKGTVGTFYIGGSVGAGGDMNMRTLIRYMEPKMGIKLVPQNVTGSRTIYNAVKLMIREPADGYTFAYQLFPHCVVERYNPSTKDSAFNYDDYYTLCNLVTDPAVVAVSAKDARFKDVNDFADLVKLIKDSGMTYLISACSVGGDDDITDHKIMMAVPEIAKQLVIVNGKGVSDGITSLLGGTLDIFAGNVGDVGTLVADGEMKVIAVFSDKRSPLLPNIKTAKECGYDITNSTSRGVVIHKDTPKEIRDKIQAYVEEIVNDQVFLDDMTKQGYIVDYKNPEEYKTWLNKEYEGFSDIAKAYGWDKK